MPTGADAGLSGIHQIMLGLKVIIKNNGIAEMSQIYSPVNQIVIKRTGDTLDEQGKASLRFFINRKAVEKGYVIKAQEKPGWQITQAGKEVYYNWRKSEEGKRILAELSGVKHVPDKKEVAAATEMNKHRLHEILKDYISEIGDI
ncbi:MAG TPA: hypothetical protein VKY45_00500 [Marinilabiliaceae bacterium]|nr:hypothetical protein [Marinilabiliaceae bacterium]